MLTTQERAELKAELREEIMSEMREGNYKPRAAATDKYKAVHNKYFSYDNGLMRKKFSPAKSMRAWDFTRNMIRVLTSNKYIRDFTQEESDAAAEVIEQICEALLRYDVQPKKESA